MIVNTKNNQIQSLESLIEFATLIAKSDLVPEGYKGKPENVITAIQLGQEIGLKPLQSLQSIYVVKGKPTLYGDALIALAKSHPDFEDIEEWQEGEIAYCKIKRKGQTACTTQFSMEDAKIAGLISRNPVWKAYPKRMLQMKSRGFAIRDCFPDALSGLISLEEAIDYPRKHGAIDMIPKPIELVPEEKINELVDKAIEQMKVAFTVEELQTIYKETISYGINEEQKNRLIETAKEIKNELLKEDKISDNLSNAINRLNKIQSISEFDALYPNLLNNYNLTYREQEKLVETAEEIYNSLTKEEPKNV